MSRIYFQNAAPGYTPATWKGSWALTADGTNGGTARALATSKSGSRTFAASSSGQISTSGGPHRLALARFISDALDAQTISGTVQMVTQWSQQNTGSNGGRSVYIWVTQGDSDTVRGVLLNNTDDYNTREITSGHTVNDAVDFLSAPVAVSSLAVSAGDRLVIECGVQAQPSSSINTYRFYYGGTGSDMALGSTDTTTEASWIEFSHTFAPGASPRFAPVVIT